MIINKEIEYNIYHRLYMFNHHVYMCIRAGNYSKLYCDPNNVDLAFNDYKEFEVFFINGSQDVITVNVIVENIQNNTLDSELTCDIITAYQNITQHTLRDEDQHIFENIEKPITAFDGKLIIPNRSINQIKNINAIYAAHTEVITGIHIAHIKETETTTIPGPKCRSCGEYDPYALIEPDNIIKDGNYTCWNCATHPYRWFKNVPDQDRESFMNHYKIHF